MYHCITDYTTKKFKFYVSNVAYEICKILNNGNEYLN